MEKIDQSFEVNKKLGKLARFTDDYAAPQDVDPNFKIARIKKLKELYADEISRQERQNQTPTYNTVLPTTAAEVRELLSRSIADNSQAVEGSKQLYAINPIYKTFVDYLSNMFFWNYKVIPHKVYSKSKAKNRKQVDYENYQILYNLMLEITDGLSIPTKFPSMLTRLFLEGEIFFTTYSDEESLTIDTILLPTKYCRRVGETQYGTQIIEFDFSYFTQLGLNNEDLTDFFKSYPKEFKTKFNRYQNDNSLRWQQLDPHFSSGVALNEVGVPTYFYLYGSILDYEKYQDNELERNENLLKYLVVHEMPHYNTDLIFETDEVKAIHASLKKKIEVNDKAKLVTTWGKMYVEKMSENDTAENQVLTKAFNTIFNNGGLNYNIFNNDSVEALKTSIRRDKSLVWKYVQQLLSFYNICINNYYDFKGYEADIEILRISPYTYNDDIRIYKDDATLGVNKLDFIIASGVKQRNISDQLILEDFLGLQNITPMQTSYTQTAEDRSSEGDDSSSKSKTDSNDDSSQGSNAGSGIEPSEKTNDQTTTTTEE